MRVIKNFDKEEIIVCPDCKSILAYTDKDIRQVIKPVFDKNITEVKYFRIFNYIDCPVCGYSHLQSYKETDNKETQEESYFYNN